VTVLRIVLSTELHLSKQTKRFAGSSRGVSQYSGRGFH